MVYLFINLLTQALLLVFLSFSCIVLQRYAKTIKVPILRRIIIKIHGIIIPVVDYQTFAVAENRHFAIFRTAYFPKFVEEDVLLKVKNMNLSSGFS